MKNFDFKDKEQILGLIDRADDKKETLKLISYFKELKNKRKPMFLDSSDFEKILSWKLRYQYSRQSKLRQLNTNEIIQKITELAFAIEHSNKDYETQLKLKILTSINGVAIPVASAILTLTYPDKFAVIDFRIWRQLFNLKKESYSTNDYLKYIEIIKKLSIKYDLTFQEIDMAIWQYDIEQNG